MRFFFQICFIFLFLSDSVTATEKRFAAVDVETQSLGATEKAALLDIVRERVSRWKIWTIISAKEQAEKLVEKNPELDELQNLKSSHRSEFERLQTELKEAEKFYRQSEFDQAGERLEKIFDSANRASLELTKEFTRELFVLLAAVNYFQGETETAREISAGLHSLDSEFQWDSNRFPPDLIEGLSHLNSVSNQPVEPIAISSSQMEPRVKFWGFPIRVEWAQGLKIFAPTRNPWLDKAFLVFEKESYLPYLMDWSSVPKEIVWRTISTKARTSKGLFGPVGALTAPPEIKWFVNQLDASVLILISADKVSDRWTLRAQWYEGKTGRLSYVREAQNLELVSALDSLLGLMMEDISPEGLVQDPRGDPLSLVDDSKPIYKKWWFWAAAGVLAVGGGLGTYFALNESESFNFSVNARP